MKVLVLLCLIASINCEPQFGSNGPWDFFGSFFQSMMEWFGGFGSGSWTPWIPSPGVALEVLDINNQSATLNCSWTSPVAGNITWLVDNESVESDSDSDDGSLLKINWEDFDKNPGNIVVVSCTGESSGKNGTWSGMSQVSETFMVPGGENVFEDMDIMNFNFTDYP